MELPFAPLHFVQVHDVVGKEAVQLLIGLVDEDEDEVEPETVVENVNTLIKERTSLVAFSPGIFSLKHESSNPVCGFRSAKPVLHGTNSTEPNLFDDGETTYKVA